MNLARRWGSRKDAKAQRESFDKIAGQTGFSATGDTYRDEQFFLRFFLSLFCLLIKIVAGGKLNCGLFVTTIYYSQSNGVIIMSTANTYVRARIDTATKIRAGKALNAMGLTVSDAIRLLMLRIADEHRLPFEIKVPNAETRKSIVELESGKGKIFASVNGLMKDINAVD